MVKEESDFRKCSQTSGTRGRTSAAAVVVLGALREADLVREEGFLAWGGLLRVGEELEGAAQELRRRASAVLGAMGLRERSRGAAASSEMRRRFVLHGHGGGG